MDKHVDVVIRISKKGFEKNVDTFGVEGSCQQVGALKFSALQVLNTGWHDLEDLKLWLVWH